MKKNSAKMGKKKKILMISLIVVAILIIVSIPVTMYLKFILRYNSKEYKEYENKMKAYGLDNLYSNNEVKSTEKVTNMEVLKIITGASLNITDISNYVSIISYNFGEEITEDSLWLNELYDTKVLNENEADESTLQQNATIEYLLKYIERCKLYLLNEMSDYMSDKNDEKLINSLKDEGIITDYEAKRFGKTLYKGDVNKIICKYIDKYSLCVVGDGKIVTDPEKLPSNADAYPYILDNVDKKVYEQPMGNNIENSLNFAEPVEVYQFQGSKYAEIKNTIEDYYNELLNIDYKTVDADKLYEKIIDSTALFVNGKEITNKYVNYVKENEITLTGKATFVEPCLYSSAGIHRARLKLEFQIVNSKTDKNILFYDLEQAKNIIYSKNAYTLYIDANLSGVANSDSLYNELNSIYSMLINMSKNELKQEGD